jgi:membrane protease YdiL (CAAX protease family)
MNRKNNLNPIKSLIKSHPQITFWVIAWATSFFGFYMRVLYPSDLWGFFIWGVLLGGVLVIWVSDGRRGLKVVFSRLIRWRVGIQWYAAALLIPLALRLVAFGLNIATGAAFSSDIQMPGWGDLIFELLITFFIVALGEELGFTGFALPRLMIGRSALAASLILGVLRTVWHLPLLITGEDHIMIILIIISGAVLNTWIFNHTKGSVFMVMLLHTSVNLWVGVFNPFFSAADVDRQTIWLAGAYVVMAVLLSFLSGRELGSKKKAVNVPT